MIETHDIDELPELPDHNSHLCAIRGLAGVIKDWNEEFHRQCERGSEIRGAGEEQVESIISLFYDTGFADAARSLAFICTIAAFFESIFKSCLPLAGKVYQGTLDPDHPRVKWAGGEPKFWDVEETEDNQTGIAKRSIAILDASNLLRLFDPDLPKLLSAIFRYRNAIVHNGYEWDVNERTKFVETIRRDGWDEWFDRAAVNGEPWSVTITQVFHDKCLTLCDKTVGAFDRLLRA